jgi:multidrug efflux system membrane fusion protein
MGPAIFTRQDLPLLRSRSLVVAEFERRYIRRVLEAHGGNVLRSPLWADFLAPVNQQAASNARCVARSTTARAAQVSDLVTRGVLQLGGLVPIEHAEYRRGAANGRRPPEADNMIARWRFRAAQAGFATVVAVVIPVALVACGPQAASAPDKAPAPVRVRQALAQASGQSAGRYSGTVEPFTRVDLSFKVAGYVRTLAQGTGPDGAKHTLQEGDFVTNGTVLAVVRESDYQARVDLARAQVAQAVAAAKQVQIDFDRITKLVASGSLAQAELDTVSSRRDTAAAQLSEAQASLSEAQIALGDCTLRAPMDGVVLKRGTEVGALVGAGSLGFTLADTRTMKVIFGAPDTLVEHFKIGDPIPITLQALPGTELQGKVTRIAPSADVTSRVFDIEAQLPNPKDRIKVGMIASLQVPGGSPAAPAGAAATLILPLTAVVRSPHDARGFAVFVATGESGKERAKVVDVKLGDVVGSGVYVVEGVAPTDRVVTMGATLIRDGDAIRLIR